MKIMFIRHADPDYSIDGLTDKGKREAELLSKKLLEENPKEIYVSPLGRAQLTAKYYLELSGRKAQTKDWLREFLAPVYFKDGTEGYMWDLYPEFLDNNRDLFEINNWKNNPLIKSGKVIEEYKRVTDGLDEILHLNGYKRNGYIYEAEKSNEDTLMFFCHFGVECIMLSHLLNIPPVSLLHGFCCAPSSVTVLYTEERVKGKAYFRCNSLGDTTHLYIAKEEPSFAARFCETYDNKAQRH